MASITDPSSRTVTFNRNGLLRVTSVVDPLGTTTYGYDSYGSVNSVVDAKNQTWSAVNDALGRVLSTTDPTSHSDATTYTTAGLLQQYQDKENVLTKLQYDPYGQGLFQVTIDAATSVLARTVVSLFDAAGQETATRAANGGWTTTQLSPVGLPLVVTDAVGDKEQYAYDWAGQMKTSRDPLGYGYQYGYNGVGRLTQLTQPDGTSYQLQYNDYGSPSVLTNPDNTTQKTGSNNVNLPSTFKDELQTSGQNATQTQYGF